MFGRIYLAVAAYAHITCKWFPCLHVARGYLSTQLSANPGDRCAPCCLSADLFVHCFKSLARRPSRALLPLGRPHYVLMYISYSSRTRPGDARGYFAVPCSCQRLAPPSSLLFRVYGHIQPKSALLHYYYIRAVRSDGSRLLSSVVRIHFFPSYSTYYNSITNPSCYQELCLLHCAA